MVNLPILIAATREEPELEIAYNDVYVIDSGRVLLQKMAILSGITACVSLIIPIRIYGITIYSLLLTQLLIDHVGAHNKLTPALMKLRMTIASMFLGIIHSTLCLVSVALCIQCIWMTYGIAARLTRSSFNSRSSLAIFIMVIPMIFNYGTFSYV
jgi:hypothetical protein